ITQLMIRFSEGVLHWWWLALLLIAGLVIAFRSWVRSPNGRLWWDEKKLSLPRVGRVMATGVYAQIAQTLAVLLTNGIPLTGALRLMQAATPNSYLKNALEEVQESVADGASLSR